MAESEDLKQLRIRSGVVKRLRKELAAYSSECEREQEKVEKMRADGADAHDIKQQVRRGTHARTPAAARDWVDFWAGVPLFIGTDDANIGWDTTSPSHALYT